MIPPSFDYHAPKSVAEALKLLGDLGGDAKLLAGGHSLLPMMKLRFAQPSHLIDLNRIAALRGIREEGSEIVIGAMTVENDVLNSRLLQQKVPLLPEVVSQICFQIIGNDVTVSMASEASELELNMAEPIIAFNLFFGLTLLRNAAIVLATRCIAGIEPNRERCREYVQNSIGLVTALNPVLGYEKSAAIAKEALKTGGSVYDLVIAKGWLTKEKLDELLKPENMTHPRLSR